MATQEEKITVTRTLPNGKEQKKTMTKNQYALLGSNPGWQHAKAEKPVEASRLIDNPEEPEPGQEFPSGDVAANQEIDLSSTEEPAKASKLKK